MSGLDRSRSPSLNLADWRHDWNSPLRVIGACLFERSASKPPKKAAGHKSPSAPDLSLREGVMKKAGLSSQLDVII